MAGMEPYGRGKTSRKTGIELSRLSARTDLEVAKVSAAAEIDSARVDGLQLVAGRAMHGVALVSQLEQQLGQMVPLAATRLQAIGDMHALASAEVVSEAARRRCR